MRIAIRIAALLRLHLDGPGFRYLRSLRVSRYGEVKVPGARYREKANGN